LRLRETELQANIEEARRRLRRIAWRITQLGAEQLAAGIREVIASYPDVGGLFSEYWPTSTLSGTGRWTPFAIWYDEGYRERHWCAYHSYSRRGPRRTALQRGT